MLPSISVIIPTYNYANYIAEAINSVVQQDYPKDKIEIIVVDDGSTDNTKEVLRDFIQSDIIKYYYQQNEGKASATYKAIQQATGKYIFNLDADDYFLEGKLQRTVTVFEGDDNIVHVGTPAKHLVPDGSLNIEQIPTELTGRSIDGSQLLFRFMKDNILYGGGSTYAARTFVLKEIVIPSGVDMYIDEFLIVALLPFGKSYFIVEALSIWRVHGNNFSLNVLQEVKLIKARRLLLSSDALLDYLIKHEFNKDLLNIYTLKNRTAHISFKELTHTKSFKDILVYAKDIFLTIRPGLHILNRYHVLNRLIPTRMFNVIKNIF